MIPSLAASRVRQALLEYLATSFALTDDAARRALIEFLDSDEGIFRGPYVQVKTPFQSVSADWQSPLGWLPENFRPYIHQAKAFRRLSTAGRSSPEPTIVTTGTGSGKTECFLYPILDHCARARERQQQGVRALLIYPMNALVDDQAKRLAELINTEPQLTGITAGIYIGAEGRHSKMGPDHLIDSRHALRKHPPDILLTNYKMLDFLLLRPEDRTLWSTGGPEELQYVVLDEVHTYDGAQGSDVAMLLRRLGKTLGADPEGPALGAAVPVATSATIASGESSKADLCQFASKLFGTRIGPEAVVGETLLATAEACKPPNFLLPIPDPFDLEGVCDSDDPDASNALAAAFCRPVGGETDDVPLTPTELGERLLEHPLTRAVLDAAGERAREWSDLVNEVNLRAPGWGFAHMQRPDLVDEALAKFLRLLSVGRRDRGDGSETPLFSIQAHVWIREIRRVLRAVHHEPSFRWADSEPPNASGLPTKSVEAALGHAAADPQAAQHWLPAVYCRRCGASGWMALYSEVSGSFSDSVDKIYRAAVDQNPNLRTLIPLPSDAPAETAVPVSDDFQWLDPLKLSTVQPDSDIERAHCLAVHPPLSEEAAQRSQCPACDERNAISFLGLRVPSLASVTLSTLLGSDLSDQKQGQQKLICFNDSVQDAAHQSSFYGARTYRFKLRSLMSQELIDAPTRVTLADMGDRLLANADHARDLYALIPPDLSEHPEITPIAAGDAPSRQGRLLLARRLAFEAQLEFGLRARVGRTLELVGAATASVEPRDIPGMTAGASLLAEEIEHRFGKRLFALGPSATDYESLDHRPPGDPVDDDGGIHPLERAGIMTYLRGLLERLRLRGAICHPFLEPYIRYSGQQWHIWGDRPEGLPAFPPGVSRPTFAITSPSRDLDSLAVPRRGTPPTWFVDWARRSLALPSPAAAAAINQVAFGLLASETKAVTHRSAISSAHVYGLNPEAVELLDVTEGSASLLACETCGHRHTAAPHHVHRWVEMPCLRYRCRGRLQVLQPAGSRPGGDENYYRNLYRSNSAPRIVTHEHTGLLSRREREDLEAAFKSGNRPDSPNVLTATPTLELGIDIGDVSAVMLSAVPPKAANYIQRSGRAGRATGNSVIVTMAKTGSHDLYYLEQPEAMVNGDVRAPSCFLDATETLKRQFHAYLLDRVADGSLSAHPLPRQMGRVMTRHLSGTGTLAQLAQASMRDPAHVESFLKMFGGDLHERSRRRLRDYANAGIESALKTAAETWHRETRELKRRRDRLSRAIKRLEAQASLGPDEADVLDDLRGQRAIAIRQLNKRRDDYALSGLERLGVLPNYTLTDDAAELQASTWSQPSGATRPESDATRPEIRNEEFPRPAVYAVTEFAPGNTFYAKGHRHRIDALDVGSSDEPTYRWWRLCGSCGHAALDDAHDSVDSQLIVPSNCPRCDSPGWDGVSRKHRLLKMETAFASSPADASRIYDESDERHQARYQRVTSVDVDMAQVGKAWRITSRPFGAEFSRNTKVRFLNVGRLQHIGRKTLIHGEELVTDGFKVCRHCGVERDSRRQQVRRADREDVRRIHRGWCKVRTRFARERWTKVLLYHELVTDALRVLLPISAFQPDTRLATMKAVVKLGLRQAFGGNPDHLRVVTSDFPNPRGGRFRFLVIYDTVPGGTGYLERLVAPHQMRRILHGARRQVMTCRCRIQGRRACHRCLLGVADRLQYEKVSGDLAIELLDEVLGDWPDAVPRSEVDSLSSLVDVDISEVEQSELESMLITALQKWAGSTDGASMRAGAKNDDRRTWVISLAGGSGKARYRMTEQLSLGTTPSTTPDFVLHSESDPQQPPVAVYLDGARYHASATHLNVAEDAAKRSGVRAEGNWVWNLTWDDVEKFYDATTSELPNKPKTHPILSGRAQSVARDVHAQRASASDPHGFNWIDVDKVNSNAVVQLLEYLRRPNEVAWSELACSAVAGLASDGDQCHLQPREVRPAIEATLRNKPLAMSPLAPVDRLPNDDLVFTAVWHSQRTPTISAFIATTSDARLGETWTVVVTLGDSVPDVERDGFLDRWKSWLRWSNLLQFLGKPHEQRCAVLTTTSQAADFDLGNLWIVPS